MYIDERYERIKVIYEARDTSVYLVRHRTLSEDRILKRIRKKDRMSEEFFIAKEIGRKERSELDRSISAEEERAGHPEQTGFGCGAGREAEILKNLRHPGIPILYDYEEDENDICLVEEYVRGVPLSEYLEWRRSISVEQICSFLVQICEILEYLHKREPFPILYQDLKPEHLYLRGEELMLIDYGAALYVPQSGQAFQKYGTPGYVAPEIVCHGTTSVQADIYSIGCVALLLARHADERIPSWMNRLIRWAMKEKPKERPASIEIYRKEWENARAKAANSGKDPFPATIVVTGASPGCGTTHIAVSLTVYLNANGRRAYFADRTDSRTTQRLGRYGPGFYEKDMIIYHHHFQAVLNTGPAVEAPPDPKGIRVVDAGCEFREDEEPDMTLCVVDSRPWQERTVDFLVIPQDAVVLLNPANRFFGRKLAGESGRKLMGFPLDADPFSLSRQKKELFGKLMSQWQTRARRRSPKGAAGSGI